MPPPLRGASCCLFALLAFPAPAPGQSCNEEGSPDAQVGELVRLVAGLQQSAASSAKSVRKVFLDGYFSTPLDGSGSLRSWGDVRATSVPQQVRSTVREFVAQEGLARTVGDVRVDELVQALQLRAGLSWEIGHLGCRKGFAQTQQQRFSKLLILGFGLITPQTPEESIEVYRASPEARSRFALADSQDFVAFATSDRTRFFREWFVGLRLKTVYFADNGAASHRFPAILDLTLGQDEAVSGGKLSGLVLGVDGFIPLPWRQVAWIHLFGSARMGLEGSAFGDALILARAPSDVTVPRGDVEVVTLDTIDRDFYRVGVGINAMELFRGFFD